MPGERMTPEEFFARFPRPNANEAVVATTPNDSPNPTSPVSYSSVLPTPTIYETNNQDFFQNGQLLPMLLIGLGFVCITTVAVVAIIALAKK